MKKEMPLKKVSYNSDSAQEEMEAVEEKVVQKTKFVRNISKGKLELYCDGKAIVLLPRQIVEVPDYLEIPKGIGLQER